MKHCCQPMLEAHAAILAFETAGFIISVTAVVARASASKRRTIRPVPAPWPRALLALRIFATIILLAALIRHASLVGIRAARKFTVWNALLLTAYFSSCLLPELSAAVADDDDDNDEDDGETALLVPTVFDRAAWPLPALHPPLLSLCLSNQLALSACTWLLLYPAVPPEQQQHLRPEAPLVEHGGGALLAAIELLLLRQPIPTNAGAVALLLFAFGLWHEVWHAATGSDVSILDYDEPTAPLMYAALVVAYVATNVAVCRLSRCAKSGRRRRRPPSTCPPSRRPTRRRRRRPRWSRPPPGCRASLGRPPDGRAARAFIRCG